MTAGDPLLESGAAAYDPLEEFRALVEEVLDQLRQRIDGAGDDVREAASIIEDTDIFESMMSTLDDLDDVIASAFERAAEKLDL